MVAAARLVVSHPAVAKATVVVVDAAAVEVVAV
jgi:hypothetical protein